MKKYLIALVMILSSNLYAQDENNLNHFRFAAIGLYEDAQSSYSGIATWNPRFYRNGRSILGASLGGSIFEDQLHKKFLMVETLLTYRYLLNNHWKLEAGVGFQSMSDEIGTHGVVSGSVHYELKKNKLNIDEVFTGYSNFSYGKEVIHQVRIGIGFHF